MLNDVISASNKVIFDRDITYVANDVEFSIVYHWVYCFKFMTFSSQATFSGA